MGLFSAIGNVVGSIIGSNSADDANSLSDKHFNKAFGENRRQFNQSLRFAKEDQRFGQEAFANTRADARNATTREFRQKMRMADESGIHRLAALGHQASYSAPSYTGAASPSVTGGPSAPSLSGDGGASALLGDGIGEGLEELLGMVTGEKKKQEKLDTESQTSRTRLNNAEAQLLEAQSRSVIRDSRRSGQLLASTDQEGDYKKRKKNVIERIKTTDGDVRDVLVGPDLDEVAGGMAVEGWDGLLDLAEARDVMGDQLGEWLRKAAKSVKNKRPKKKRGASIRW
ncbi:hypothetical protein [Microviridae sp.]|nr:hypothetical protein [Microviridae sp.]